MKLYAWLAGAAVFTCLGWVFGTPYLNTLEIYYGQKPTPSSCGYIGLQGRIIARASRDSCQLVRLVKWDNNRNLFGWEPGPGASVPLPRQDNPEISPGGRSAPPPLAGTPGQKAN
jgi:hypothetical protein